MAEENLGADPAFVSDQAASRLDPSGFNRGEGLEPDPLVITGEGGRLLFAIRADGTAEGSVADASEAARILAERVVYFMALPLGVREWPPA